MKKTDEQLQNQNEEQLFAFYLNELITNEGEDLIRQNHVLSHTMSDYDRTQLNEISETLQIKDCCVQVQRQKQRRKHRRLRVALSFAAVLTLFLTTVCAGTPLLQDGKQCTVIEQQASGVLSFGQKSIKEVDFPETLLGYSLPEFPKGFTCTSYIDLATMQKLEMRCFQQQLDLTVSFCDDSGDYPIKEDGISVNILDINGMPAYIYKNIGESQQEQLTKIVAIDTQHNRKIELYGVGLEPDTIIEMMNEIQYVE